MDRFLLILFCLLGSSAFCQGKLSDTLKLKETVPVRDSVKSDKTDADVIQDINKINTPAAIPQYSPMKAGLYSAVLPGLGQFYNKKYWKIPIVWGGIGTGVGIIIWNNRYYNRYRNAYIAELNGQTHEFSDIPGISKEVLGRTQDKFKRQRDYSIAITGLVYVLNIVDAVVDAHLYAQKHDPDLALKPVIIYDEYSPQYAKAGLSLNFKF
ncbi:DUF5683 domain-containing protein [Weeksellaceae bacterium A-14]|uniref:DUF5683 domain-containing protein n=1 Tax=Daejeonia sp. YH14 TaxID=3439042 RepID=UPI0031E4CE94